MNNISVVVKFYRHYRWLYNHHFKTLSRICYRITYVLFNCIIPPTADLRPGVNIGHGVGIVIHDKATIGDNTIIYQNVTIGGGPRHIGENCVIGTGAVVLADIGNNVNVGANAVVLHDVPDNVTVVGIPAKIVKKKDI